jgi:hypothetical protein
MQAPNKDTHDKAVLKPNIHTSDSMIAEHMMITQAINVLIIKKNSVLMVFVLIG